MEIIENGIARGKDEDLKDYQVRLCMNRKNLNLTWDEVGQALNEELGVNKSESVYRKWWYAFNEGLEYNKANIKIEEINLSSVDVVDNTVVNSVTSEIEELKEEVKKIEVEMGRDGSQKSTIRVKLTEEQSKDTDHLLKIHGYDPDCWEITKARQSVWNQNSKQDGMIDLYSSKIEVKPRSLFNWSKDNVNKIFESIESKKDEWNSYNPIDKENGLKTLFIPLADLHFGLRSVESLAGEEYNPEIAADRLFYVIHKITEGVVVSDIDNVVLLVGNDAINADNITGTTTKGTPQDNALNWFETVDQFTNLIIKVIDNLYEIAPVSVQYVPSNHDLHTMYGVVKTLDAHYRENKDIFIDISPKTRKYIQLGNNMIGFSHDERDKNISKIMASEEPEMWGLTKHKYYFACHLHHEIVKDDFGVDIRRLPTFSGTSAWAKSSGYVGTKKQGQGFVFDSKNGLINIVNVIVD